MSTPNQISTAIPAETLAEVLSHLQACKAALAPYLQALTTEQKHDLFKMGDKTVATVQKVKSYLETNPEFIPPYMDTKEFLKDEELVTGLDPLRNLAEQLASDLSDTAMLAGSEALVNALLYYGTAKEAAAKGVLAAAPIYEDLRQQFVRKNHA
jgi:hypothetical protein